MFGGKANQGESLSRKTCQSKCIVTTSAGKRINAWLMKRIIFLVACTMPLALLCQEIQNLDSVEVFARRRAADVHIQKMDSAVLKNSATENLGDVLQKSSSINVNANGFFGQVSSPSVGGLGSDHVKIHWEGIELNQLTLGSFDLSLFPSFLASSVSINSGSDYNTLNTGAFGSGINITSTSNSNRFALGFGSFGYRSAYVQVSETYKKLKVSVKPYIIYGDNDFKYLEKRPRETVEKISEHNTLQQQGLQSNIAYGDKLKVGIWWQGRSKQLPATLQQNKNSKAVQFDKNQRVFVRYTPNVHWYVQADYSNDYLSYRDKLSSQSEYTINSNIRIKRYGLNARYRTYVGPVRIQTETQALNYGIESSGFSSIISQWRTQHKVSAFYQKNWFFTHMASKLIALESEPVRNTLSAAVGVSRGANSVSYGIDQRFKLPDFNDLYWAQGGNPNLKNEEGLSHYVLFTHSQKMDLDFKVSFTELENKIQWIPGPQYWSPINIGQLRSISFDANAGKKIKTESGGIQLDAFANYSRAQVFENDAYQSEQVPYLPAYKVGFSADAVRNNTSVFVSSYYMSKRFTDFNNDELFALGAYWNVDLGITQQCKLGNTPIELQLKVNNLLNNTELLALARPNPGRYFRFTLSFAFDS